MLQPDKYLVGQKREDLISNNNLNLLHSQCTHHPALSRSGSVTAARDSLLPFQPVCVCPLVL